MVGNQTCLGLEDINSLCMLDRTPLSLFLEYTICHSLTQICFLDMSIYYWH
jgi:hypothetical protein